MRHGPVTELIVELTVEIPFFRVELLVGARKLQPALTVIECSVYSEDVHERHIM